jgi:hypothetical protein
MLNEGLNDTPATKQASKFVQQNQLTKSRTEEREWLEWRGKGLKKQAEPKAGAPAVATTD